MFCSNFVQIFRKHRIKFRNHKEFLNKFMKIVRILAKLRNNIDETFGNCLIDYKFDAKNFENFGLNFV